MKLMNNDEQYIRSIDGGFKPQRIGLCQAFCYIFLSCLFITSFLTSIRISEAHTMANVRIIIF